MVIISCSDVRCGAVLWPMCARACACVKERGRESKKERKRVRVCVWGGMQTLHILCV